MTIVLAGVAPARRRRVTPAATAVTASASSAVGEPPGVQLGGGRGR